MQETRRQILEILRERGEATVDDIVVDLQALRGSITAVTVRHHLSKLQVDGLVDTPQMRHRSTPGRPQHIYALTHHGESHFPNNYQRLAEGLLQQIEARLPESEVNVIMECLADDMANEAAIPSGSLADRMEAVVEYLNTHGYEARYEVQEQDFVLYTMNCPYHQIAQVNEHLCHMDMRLISKMLGVVPRIMNRISEGEPSCAYLIPQRDKKE